MTIVEIIKDVGFPIGAFLLMFYHSNKTVKENTKAINDLKNVIKNQK